MTRRTRVYIAGPITTSGNLLLNVQKALLLGSDLLARGYAPYVPHLNCFWEIVSPNVFKYEDWLALDQEYLLACDAVIRLPGESKGADQEVAWANDAGIPVFFTLSTLLACVAPKTPTPSVDDIDAACTAAPFEEDATPEERERTALAAVGQSVLDAINGTIETLIGRGLLKTDSRGAVVAR